MTIFFIKRSNLMYQQPPSGGQQPYQPGPSYPNQQPPPQTLQKPSAWHWYRSRGCFLQGAIGCLALCVLIVFGFFCSAAVVSITRSTTASGSTPVVVATTAPQLPTKVSISTPRPTPVPKPMATPTPQSVHYPPTTEADLHSLAAKGDASSIHEFHSESVGLVACPQPKREVTVDPGLTGEPLAEDLLAYFYAQQIDSPCGSVVFAYHTQIGRAS